MTDPSIKSLLLEAYVINTYIPGAYDLPVVTVRVCTPVPIVRLVVDVLVNCEAVADAAAALAAAEVALPAAAVAELPALVAAVAAVDAELAAFVALVAADVAEEAAAEA